MVTKGTTLGVCPARIGFDNFRRDGGTSQGDTTPVVVPNSGGWNGYTPYGLADYQHTGQFGIIAAQNSTGNQFYYPVDQNGSGAPTEIGTGWTSNLAPFGVAQFTGDGSYDIFTCRADTKNLMMYPGDAVGGFASPRTILGGCDRYTPFGVTDYNGDGNPDLILRDNTTGNLVIPGNGSESTPTAIGTVIAAGSATTQSLIPYGAVTWTPPGTTTRRIDIYTINTLGDLLDYTETPGAPLSSNPTTIKTTFATRYRPVGVADFNHDGYPDLEAIDTAVGDSLVIFLGSANGIATAPTTIPGSGGWTSNYRPFGVTDFQKNGHTGIITAQNDTQNLYYYPVDLSISNNPILIGGGWSTNFTPFGITDIDGDGNSDIVTCRANNGRLMEYPGNGASGFFAARTILIGCTNYTPFGLTDYNGDGNPDLIVRDNTTGNLIIDAGTGGGWWINNNTTTITTGW